MADLIIWVLIISIGFFFGSAREKKHLANLKKREALLLTKVPTRADQGPKLTSGSTFLVKGSVVIAMDGFKNFVGGLKNFIGGRLTTHESLLDRARREAVCRLRENAQALGAREVVDIHIQTSFIDQMGTEVSAYGTAVKP